MDTNAPLLTFTDVLNGLGYIAGLGLLIFALAIVWRIFEVIFTTKGGSLLIWLLGGFIAWVITMLFISTNGQHGLIAFGIGAGIGAVLSTID